MLKKAPFQFVNLDEVKVHKISIKERDVIYSTRQAPADDAPVLGQLSDVTLANDQFYIYDLSVRDIFRMDRNGNVEGPLTRRGKGPGEHNSAGYLTSNASYIYLSDGNNARIDRYIRKMKPVEPLGKFLSASREIAVNNQAILTVNRNSAGFSPSNPDEGLIAVSSLDNLTDTLATILPRIIPPGYQPGVYNGVDFSMNNKQTIAANYSPLPWIFLFDKNYQHTRTLILTYSVFDKMDIPAMDFFKPKGNEGFGGTMPITQYKLMDNGDIFISISKKLILLTSSSSGKYRAEAVYQVMYDGEPQWIANIFLSPEGAALYACNRKYLFRIHLPD